MQVFETSLKGCFVFRPESFKDNRGTFYEFYRKERFEKSIGKKIDFVQDNYSISKKSVLRGLHFQANEFSQSKLVHVLEGEVLDVVVDLRMNSSTFGEYFKLRISGQNKKSIFIPKGMAHGFLTLSEEAIFGYKCDSYYKATSESGIFYKDKDLNIDWEYPDEKLILSKKDRNLPTFKELFR